MMTKNFVNLLFPGTLFSESSIIEISEWNVDKAKEIANSQSRKPYGFNFVTRGRREDELDSKELNRSGTYYFGGKIKTLADVESENDPKNRILIDNMKSNNYEKVIYTSRGGCIPFNKDDVLLGELN